MSYSILVGQAEEQLAKIPRGSVQCGVTSPPYWPSLRNYGVPGAIGDEKLHDCLGWATKDSCDECYVCHIRAIFQEIWHVLRDDGTFWLNLGDAYAKKNVPGPVPLKRKDLCLIPSRVALALQADGWYVRNDNIWKKSNPMPRSGKDALTPSHEYVWLLTKKERYYFDVKAIEEPSKTGDMRRPYGSKGMWEKDGRPKEKQHGGKLRKQDAVGRNDYTGFNDRYKHKAMRRKRDVWEFPTNSFKPAAKHFATFPPTLPEICIKAGSKPGDIVLDPFAGSGTTGEVALKLKRRFVGVELNASYVDEILIPRLSAVAET